MDRPQGRALEFVFDLLHETFPSIRVPFTEEFGPPIAAGPKPKLVFATILSDEASLGEVSIASRGSTFVSMTMLWKLIAVGALPIYLILVIVAPRSAAPRRSHWLVEATIATNLALPVVERLTVCASSS